MQMLGSRCVREAVCIETVCFFSFAGISTFDAFIFLLSTRWSDPTRRVERRSRSLCACVLLLRPGTGTRINIVLWMCLGVCVCERSRETLIATAVHTII